MLYALYGELPRIKYKDEWASLQNKVFKLKTQYWIYINEFALLRIFMESSDATTIQNVWAGLGIMRKEDCKWIEKQGCSDPRK